MNIKSKKKNQNNGPKFNYIIDVMLHIKLRRNKGDKVKPEKIDGNGEMEIIPMLLSCVKNISSVVMVLPNDLIKRENKMIVRDTFKEVMNHFKESLPLMDPLEDMNIEDEKLNKATEKMKKHQEQEKAINDSLTIDVKANVEFYQKKQDDQKKLRFLNEKLDQGGEMILKDDLNSMKRVMRRLGLLDKNDIVLDKGRVAGEVSSCDELMVTELLLSGFFNQMKSEEITAILTCFVHDSNKNDSRRFVLKNEVLSTSFQKILSEAERLQEIYMECKLNIDKDAYINSFNPHLMEVAYRWCEGATFGDICKLTDCYEGSIIRCFRRLEELLKELCNCAKVMGNQELQTKFEVSSEKLKRGIVFAASLYL